LRRAQLLTYRAGLLDEDALVPSSDPRAFVAVALEAGGDHIAAIGALGVAIEPPFEFDALPSGGMFDFDVALRKGETNPS